MSPWKRLGPQPLAIVIDRHRSVDHLVAAVAIDIGDRKLVIAASGIVALARLAAVEQPALGQLAVAPVPGGDRGAGIIAAAKDHRGQMAVEIGDTGQEPVGSVGIAIAPAFGQLLRRGIAAGIAWRIIGGGGQCLAGEAVEDGQIFRPLDDAALHRCDLGAIGQHLGAGAVALGHFAIMAAPVGLGVADHRAGAVDRAVGGLHRHFGATVAVEVEGQELGIMGAGADIAAKVDAP